ncbi:MAG TPA: hypothetical protein VKY26_10120 [Actinomycetota bacterium]|nr:hypothetical protein [Actinomycetota bacterium]
MVRWEAWGLEAAGAAMIAVATFGVIRTLLLPGSRLTPVQRLIENATDLGFRAVARMGIDGDRRHRVRSIHAPLILIIQLWSWLAAYLAGFGLVLWAVNHSVSQGFREAGSSLLTMGFAVTHGGPGTAIDLVAGATGLIVVALQIAYLPTLYTAYNRRESEVSLLAIRAGEPSWGPELIARAYLMGSLGELPALWASWERWAADVAESHSSYPVLIRFRTADPLSSWLTGFLAVLDSAALWAAIKGPEAPLQARLFLRMGFGCLQQVAKTVRIPFNPDPRPDDPIVLTEEEFGEGLARLRSYGMEIERPVDKIWVDFKGWRVNYEGIAYQLAREIDAPPALWSGPRRIPTPSIPPRRLLDRTPEDPEGLTGGLRGGGA